MSSQPVPLVSVVIPCYNAAAFIVRTLESVYEQDGVQVDVVIVDDGSSDGSPDIVKPRFPAARLLHTPRLGPSGARNAGTRAVRGEFIQYLDADDLLAPGKLRRQLTALQASGADVAYGDWQRLAPTADGYRPADVVSQRLNDPEIDLFTNFWCPPAAYLFRRSVVDRVGGWNEQLPIIQDARFVLDCALQGAHFVRADGLMALYRAHVTGSVSTRDPAAFVRDCLRNAVEIEAVWMENGGLDARRRAALVQAYEYVARGSYEHDRPTFDAAVVSLERLRPGYVPSHPRDLALVSRLMGYRRAELVALWYRRARKLPRSIARIQAS